jgi:opacity protein-like surface antigen
MKTNGKSSKSLIGRLFSIVSAALVSACFLGTIANGQTCIPLANGVPGTTTFQHAPNWWDNVPGFPLFNTAIDDPQWRGAVSHTYSLAVGTTEEVRFRALHRPESGTEFLYLSWHVKTALDVANLNNNLLWVGFRNPAGGGTDVAFKIALNVTSNQTAAGPAEFSPAITVKAFTASDTSWAPYAGVPSIPAWLNTTTKVWITNSPKSFAIHMRIPMTASTDLNNGVNIANPFQMWFELRVKSPSNPNGFVTYKWPRAIADMNAILDTPPPVLGWGDFRLTSATPESPDPMCPTNGVAIRPEDIGTTNADPLQINILTPNTFFAKPRNQTPSAVNNIRARFRMANWGVHPSWEDVPSPSTTLWADIASPGGVPPLGVSIPNGMQGNITVPFTLSGTCERCQYDVFYNANQAMCDAAVGCATTNNTRRTHQCLLVELSGPGVTFLNDSVYRNMNFANASTFSEQADVDIRGLSLIAGNLGRDVYFYLETTNMPSVVSGGGQNPPGVSGGVPTPSRTTAPLDPKHRRSKEDQIRATLNRQLAAGSTTFEDLARSMPTLRVHAYYDSGLRKTLNGVSHPILRPLIGFGYVVIHVGEVNGWKATLAGAQELAPDWYKIAVPNSGVATITTTIEALEPTTGGGPLTQGQHWGLSLHAGANFPHGGLSAFDSGFSFTADLEYRVNNNFSVEGLYGFNRFKPGLNLHNLSGNGKFYFGSASTRPFFNAGVGAYVFNSGTVHAGANLGAGLQFNVNPNFAVEAAYNFHEVFTSGSHPRFSTLQGGIRFRF